MNYPFIFLSLYLINMSFPLIPTFVLPCSHILVCSQHLSHHDY